MDDPGNRTAEGKFLPGKSGNPSGRPRAFREYQQWLTDNALDKAKAALLACLDDPDGKTRMMAVKEVHDRLYGKAPQAITNEDGSPLFGDAGKHILESLGRLGGQST